MLGVETNLNTPQLVDYILLETNSFFDERHLVKTPHPDLIKKLIEARKFLSNEGWGQFDPIYIPSKQLKPDDQYPGWSIKPQESYWDEVSRWKGSAFQKYCPALSLQEEAARLQGYWGLLETIPRPSFEDGQQSYKDDPLGTFLEKLRDVISNPQLFPDVPPTSRSGVGAFNLYNYLFPRLLREWGLVNEFGEARAEVKLLSGIELNYIGNLRPNYGLGESNTAEELRDLFIGCEWVPTLGGARMMPLFYNYRLIGGNSDLGGLAHIGAIPNKPDSYKERGFRCLIVFPERDGK